MKFFFENFAEFKVHLSTNELQPFIHINSAIIDLIIYLIQKSKIYNLILKVKNISIHLSC